MFATFLRLYAFVAAAELMRRVVMQGPVAAPLCRRAADELVQDRRAFGGRYVRTVAVLGVACGCFVSWAAMALVWPLSLLRAASGR